jgi:hypothetical protein
MSRNVLSEAEYKESILSINPLTNLPYPASWVQAANGQGTRTWQSVFATISSQSAIDGAALGYLPSTVFSISNDTSTFSSIVATSYSTLSTQIGAGGIPGSITTYQLQSTVTWMQVTSKYISTGDLVSSMTPFLNGNLSFMSNIQSTVIGLGSTRYISSPQLLSTTTGLNTQSRSTVIGLGATGYISSLSLQSTVNNLAQANYVSTSMLLSTMTGLLYPATSPGGNLGVVVTGTADSPFKNFELLSQGYLGSNNYVNTSNAGGYGFVFSNQLPSTTTGLINNLGTLGGYVSTLTLQSTSAGIQAAKQNIFIDRMGVTSIYNSQVSVSSIDSVVYFSTFVNSTLTYAGNSGVIAAQVQANSNLYFSTANLQLSHFSNYITSNSRVTVELYPTFTFDTLTTGALTSKAFTMTTNIQYGATVLATSNQTLVIGTSATNGYSNYFQQPLKLTFPGSLVAGAYASNYMLTHTVTGGLSYITNVGFRNSNLEVFYGPKNSYFVSVQNL